MFIWILDLTLCCEIWWRFDGFAEREVVQPQALPTSELENLLEILMDEIVRAVFVVSVGGGTSETGAEILHSFAPFCRVGTSIRGIFVCATRWPSSQGLQNNP